MYQKTGLKLTQHYKSTTLQFKKKKKMETRPDKEI